MNELRRVEGGKELTKALESVETIMIVQESINNVVRKMNEDKAKVSAGLDHMNEEFGALRSQLST